MFITLAAILVTLLTGCASEYQTSAASSNSLNTSLPPTVVSTIETVASATPTTLNPTPFLSHHSNPTQPTPITPQGEGMIYIIQFHQPLDTPQRDQFLVKLAQQLGRPVTVIYHYTVAYQGIALKLMPQEANLVATMPQVKHIQLDTPRYSQPNSSHHLDATQTE